MDAEKFPDLLSASWKTSKASGIIQPKFKILRASRYRSRSASVQGQKKVNITGQTKRVNLPFFYLFIVLRP